MMWKRKTESQTLVKQNSWMVTLSDLLILLLTFFVLLISMSSMDKKVFKKMFGAFPYSLGVLNMGGSVPSQEKREGLIVRPVAKSRSIADLAALRKLSPSLSKLLDDLEASAIGACLTASVINDDLHLDIASDFLFGTLDATPRPSAKKLLSALAGFVVKQPGKLFVEVYTDNFPLHTEQFADNWVLASVRGNVVAGELQRQGVPESRLALSVFGPDRPLVKNDTPENRARNRRVVIRLAGWYSRLKK
jgi:chemotaxis protein MotB